jgi:hypothetical protein
MALGVNLAKFEFPSYFNLFMQRKRCTLVVDSLDAERNIGSVFNKTLLGPVQSRSEGNASKQYEEEGESRGLKMCVRAHGRRMGLCPSCLVVLGVSPPFN